MRVKFVLVILFLSSCRNEERIPSDKSKTDFDNIENHESYIEILNSTSTVYDFLKFIKLYKAGNSFGFVRMTQEFPSDWVKEADIDKLMTLIASREKCNCILNPMSSNIPIGDSADLGGYAIAILNAHRQNRPFQIQTWACPKTNQKDVDDLTRWRVASK